MDKPEKSAWPWTRIALVVSLGVNLLVVGAVAGALLSGGPDPRGTAERRAEKGLPIGPYGRAFSQQDRAELRRAFEARKPLFEQSRRDMRAVAGEIANIVRADPFDPAALKAAFGQQSTLQQAVRAEGQTLLIERLTNMSAAERQAFAEKLEAGLKRGRRRN